jgi:cyclophilin family peptidyl-prolyl cis-trans isomerase
VSTPASSSPGSVAPRTVEPAPEDSQAPAGTDCEYVSTGTAARPVSAPAATNVPLSGELTAVVTMTGGPVRITLDRVGAPCTVNSFVSLVEQGFYTKTRCHRLVDSGIFVLQCGDPTGSGTGGPGYTFADELDGTEKYSGGVVAMANGGPNTNGSQFFFVYQDSAALEPNYTIFGSVDAASQRVVATMAEEGQDGKNPQGGGRPNNPSEIISVTLR